VVHAQIHYIDNIVARGLFHDLDPSSAEDASTPRPQSHGMQAVTFIGVVLPLRGLLREALEPDRSILAIFPHPPSDIGYNITPTLDTPIILDFLWACLWFAVHVIYPTDTDIGSRVFSTTCQAYHYFNGSP
jgi:hypothetical protein